MKKKLFIFDWGEVNVLGVTIMPQIAKEYGLDYEQFMADYRIYETPLMDGTMDPDDYLRHMEIRFNIDKVSDDTFIKFFNPQENEYMKNIVALLKANGHRVVVGSNTFRPHWEEYIVDKFSDILALYDNVYASHQIFLSKPQKAFLNYIMDKEGFKPDETVFIDDNSTNIEAARSLGIEVFQYLQDNAEADRFFSRYIHG